MKGNGIELAAKDWKVWAASRVFTGMGNGLVQTVRQKIGRLAHDISNVSSILRSARRSLSEERYLLVTLSPTRSEVSLAQSVFKYFRP